MNPSALDVLCDGISELQPPSPPCHKSCTNNNGNNNNKKPLIVTANWGLYYAVQYAGGGQKEGILMV